MRCSGSTMFFLDLDIFSTRPLSTGLLQCAHRHPLFSPPISSLGKSHPCSSHRYVSLETMPCVRRLVKRSSTFTSPRSRTALVKEPAYSRCRTACSIPPMYWSTAIHRSAFSGSTGRVVSWGEQYRRKYQDESTKVSIVSVSRRPGPLHFGH